MSGMFAFLIVFVVPLLLIVALATMPRWCVRVLHQNQLWAIRDAVVEDMLAGRLPADHRSVRSLVRQLRAAADECMRFNLLVLLAYRRAIGRHEEAAAALRSAYLRDMNPAGLTREQRERLDAHRARLHMTLNSSVMFGSWLGIFFFVFFFVRAIGRAIARGATSVARAGVASIHGGMRSKVAAAAHEPAQELDRIVDDVCFPLAR